MENINFKSVINQMQSLNRDVDEVENVYKNAFNGLVYDDFEVIIKHICESEQKKFGKDPEYILNSENREMIKSIYTHLTEQYHKSKGILLCGKFGCGKTLLMSAFLNFINYHSIKLRLTKWKMIESKTQIFDSYKDCFLIIDEIGRENSTIKTYGNETTPFIDHMLYRYNRGLKTFGITNFSMDTLKEKYGQYVTDRFGEMFEIIELKDINHRK